MHYRAFSKWLDRVLLLIPVNVKAVNFLLFEVDYDDIEAYHIHLSDAQNPYDSIGDNFLILRTEEIARRLDGLTFVSFLIEKYLEEGKSADLLKEFQSVGIGFIDGGIRFLHVKSDIHREKNKAIRS